MKVRPAIHWGLVASRSAVTPLRVCAVSYLNTAPLVWGLREEARRGAVELTFALPSACADALEAGDADVGLVPVAELLRQPLEVIPGLGIACRGPVRSILLISRVPWARVRTLATDTSSRTSVQLARVLLDRLHGAHPGLLPHGPDLEAMLDRADAALIIGDPALRLDPDSLPYRVLDLGAEWVALTGLPMVFAVWARRPGPAAPGLQELLRSSYEQGRAHLDEIVAEEAVRLRNLPAALADRYLREHIVYEIGPREREGLDLFLRSVRALPNPTLMGVLAHDLAPGSF